MFSFQKLYVLEKAKLLFYELLINQTMQLNPNPPKSAQGLWSSPNTNGNVTNPVALRRLPDPPLLF